MNGILILWNYHFSYIGFQQLFLSLKNKVMRCLSFTMLSTNKLLVELCSMKIRYHKKKFYEKNTTTKIQRPIKIWLNINIYGNNKYYCSNSYNIKMKYH